MRAMFGIVSLLVVLAIVGLLASKQMKTAVPTLDRAASAVPGATGVAAPTGNVREQSQQMQQRVQSDVAKALEQGAAARAEASDK